MMKRIIFIIFAVLSIHTINAQIAGIRGGFNMSSITGDSPEGTDFTSGYYAGILVEINVIDKYLFLQPEVNYSRQGTVFDENISDQALNLSYINTPLLFKTYISNSFSVQVGPQIGFLANKPIFKTKNNSYNLTKSDFKNVDFSAVFGASFYTPSGFFIEARYQLGLKNVFDTTKTSTANQKWNLKNQVFSIGAGFLF